MNSLNYKILMKEIKIGRNKWRDMTQSWIGKISIIKMTYIQHNLQIQCNPYQITNGIFTGVGTKIFIIYTKA